MSAEMSVSLQEFDISNLIFQVNQIECILMG